MSRINQISPEAATGKSKELLDAVKSKLGLVPNLTRALATASLEPRAVGAGGRRAPHVMEDALPQNPI